MHETRLIRCQEFYFKINLNSRFIIPIYSPLTPLKRCVKKNRSEIVTELRLEPESFAYQAIVITDCELYFKLYLL